MKGVAHRSLEWLGSWATPSTDSSEALEIWKPRGAKGWWPRKL